jgi:hypothetical protein
MLSLMGSTTVAYLAVMGLATNLAQAGRGVVRTLRREAQGELADTGKEAVDALVDEEAQWQLVIVRRPEGEAGWVKLPIRWTVERTFAWLGKSAECREAMARAEIFVDALRKCR